MFLTSEFLVLCLISSPKSTLADKFSSLGNDFTRLSSFNLPINFGIDGFPLGPALLVSCGGRFVGRLTDLFTRLAPISLLGAGLCFLRTAEVIKL